MTFQGRYKLYVVYQRRGYYNHSHPFLIFQQEASMGKLCLRLLIESDLQLNDEIECFPSARVYQNCT